MNDSLVHRHDKMIRGIDFCTIEPQKILVFLLTSPGLDFPKGEKI